MSGHTHIYTQDNCSIQLNYYYCHGGPTWALTKKTQKRKEKKRKEAAEQCTCKHVAMRV